MYFHKEWMFIIFGTEVVEVQYQMSQLSDSSTPGYF